MYSASAQSRYKAMKELSICIPVYNFDVGPLAEELNKQLSAIDIPSEIVLMDDASGESYRQTNRQLAGGTTRYIQLEKNIGRSKIRNRLAEEARYQYLIFMDCDSRVPSPHYINDYLAQCHPGIVCYGGCVYDKNPPQDKTLHLRWKYGIKRESATAAERSRHPNFGFRTNNFLIDKAIFNHIGFDESLQGYGHEDTLFGLELMTHNIPVVHIDNPLVHIGLESAPVFLSKTASSVANLSHINTLLKERYPEYINHSRLASTYQNICRVGLRKPAALLLKAIQPFLRRNLSGDNPSLRAFDLYRLGLLFS